MRVPTLRAFRRVGHHISRQSPAANSSRSSCYTLPMKAVVITSLSGPGSLKIQEMPEPTPRPGQIIVRVGAGGLNFADFMTSKGGYPGTPPPPLIAGREF